MFANREVKKYFFRNFVVVWLYSLQRSASLIESFRHIPQSLWETFLAIPQIVTQLLASSSVPFHFSLIIILFDPMPSEILTESLNKYIDKTCYVLLKVT